MNTFIRFERDAVKISESAFADKIIKVSIAPVK